MERVNKYFYRVERGEKVTFTFTLQSLPANAVSMGDPWKRDPGSGHPKFSFTIPETGDQKIFNAVAEVSFVSPQTGAKAQISVEGSKGGGSFDAVTITANSTEKDPGFMFKVKQN